MKELRQLQARNLQIEINRGAGMDELCAIYGATREEIEGHIRRLYNQSKSAANGILGKLAKNDGRARKKRKIQPSEGKNRSAEEIIVTEEKSAAAIPQEAMPTMAVTADEVTSDSTAANELVLNLDEARAQAKALSDEVIELELKHEGLRSQRLKLKDEIGELSTRLTKLRKQIVSIGEEYREKSERFNQAGEEMLSISEIKSLKIGKLDELNARIEQLCTVELFIYDDGSIVAENRPDINLSASGHEEVYDRLLHSNEDWLDLKKSQLMLLSRVICIVDNLGSVTNLELSFDDEEIELAYGLFRETA